MDRRASRSVVAILDGIPILLVDFGPEPLHLLQTIGIEGLPEASAVSEAPLEVIVDGQHRLDEHLTRSVDGDYDQHPLSVGIGSCSGFRDDDVNVDHDVCEEAVVEEPI